MESYGSLSEARAKNPRALAFVECGDRVFAFQDWDRAEPFVYDTGGRLYVVAWDAPLRRCPNGHPVSVCRCGNHS